MYEAWAAGLAGMLRSLREDSGSAGAGPDSDHGARVDLEGGGYLLRPALTAWGRDVPLAAELYYHPVTDSTNTRLKALLAGGAGAGTVVVAGAQTAGRGRHGRDWFSPPDGGLYVSLLLRPRAALDRPGWVTLGTALALVRAGTAQGIPLGIKWPNDVLCRGRKTAGILVEAGSDERRMNWLIIGTGINLYWTVPVPPEVAAGATTLESCAGRRIDPDRLMADFLQELWELTLEVLSGEDRGPPAWAGEVEAHLTHFDRPVTVRTGQGEVSGRTVGLSAEGWLLLDGGRRIMTGELVQ